MATLNMTKTHKQMNYELINLFLKMCLIATVLKLRLTLIADTICTNLN